VHRGGKVGVDMLTAQLTCFHWLELCCSEARLLISLFASSEFENGQRDFKFVRLK